MSTTPMQVDTEQQPVRRSQRSVARKSVAQLQERARAIAAEETEALWGAGALEDEDDHSFDEAELSDKGEDIIDSDFDDPEEKEDDRTNIAEPQKQARRAIRARGKYVDPAEKEKRAHRRSEKRKTQHSGEKRKRRQTANSPPAVGRASLRKSTKIASELAAEARAARDEAARKRNRKEPVIFTMPTQEELLEEAKITEVANRASLQELLRLEAEKKRQLAPRKKDRDHMVSLRSRGGKSTVSFTDAKTNVKEVLFPQTFLNSKNNQKSKQEEDDS